MNGEMDRLKAKYRQEAFSEAAAMFEVYAGDIDGAIRKNWYAAEKKIQAARRDQLLSCAADLRKAAEAEARECV